MPYGMAGVDLSGEDSLQLLLHYNGSLNVNGRVLVANLGAYAVNTPTISV